MNAKSLIWIGAFVGGAVGAYIPALWGDTSLLSFSSIITSTIGGILGIWVGYRFGESL